MAKRISRAHRRRHAAIGVTGLLIFAVAILAGLGAVTFLIELQRPDSSRVYLISGAGAAADPAQSIDLQLVLVQLAPWDGTVQLQVSGHQTCSSSCTGGTRLLFVSLPILRNNPERAPVVATLTIARDAADVNQNVTLPVAGEWIDYPLDQYRLRLGIVVQRVQPDATVQPLTPAQAQGSLMTTIQDHLPDLKLATPQPIDPASVPAIGGDEGYVLVTDLTLQRAVYIQSVTAAVVGLALAAALFGVLFRPLKEVAVGAMGLTLSLWGVRSLLLGNAPGVTSVDVVLTGVIIFVFSGIVVRVLIALIRDEGLI